MGFTGPYGFDIHKVRSDSQGTGPDLDKIGGGFERNAACRDDLYLRKGPFKVFDIALSADRSPRKDLDKISPGAPGGHDLERGQHPRHQRGSVSAAHHDMD